jgi:hypothetical protein
MAICPLLNGARKLFLVYIIQFAVLATAGFQDTICCLPTIASWSWAQYGRIGPFQSCSRGQADNTSTTLSQESSYLHVTYMTFIQLVAVMTHHACAFVR